MKNSRLTLPAVALLLLGCNDTTTEGNTAPPTNNGTVTHLVCATDGPNVGIDNASEIVLIDSLTVAAGNLYPSVDDVNAEAKTQAWIAMLASNLVSASSLFYHIYKCTPETYALNTCNYSLSGDDSVVQIETTVTNHQAYTTNVKTGATLATANTVILSVSGTIGDSGNISFEVFDEDDGSSHTISATRDGNGNETVAFQSDDLEWTMSEAADCSGSFSYTSTDDEDESNTVTAQWAYSEDVTSGSGTHNGVAFSW